VQQFIIAIAAFSCSLTFAKNFLFDIFICRATKGPQLQKPPLLKRAVEANKA